MLDEAAWKLIEEADWERIGLVLTRYAHVKARNRRWKTESYENLPQGKTPDDIVQEAIEKTLNGDRKWNRERYPCILDHLKSVIDSLISHLYDSKNHSIIRRFPESQDGVVREDTFQQWNLSSPPTQERKVLADERVSQIYEAIGEDTELQAVMDAIMEGHTKPRDITRLMGVDVKRVNQLKRKLDRMLDRLDRNE